MSNRPALVVDDTHANRDFLERLLTQAGFAVKGASTGKDALQIVDQSEQLLLAVVDLELPDVSGLEVTRSIRTTHPDAYIVVASMHDQRSLIKSAYDCGGNCYMVKPHGFMELFKRLTTSSIADLYNAEHMIIDQYGPRVFQFVAKDG